ncbi:MAG: MBL fold metallo-hydrolase [Gemmatimonadetes bacterium]|nr:MBL fold metallo-hydrolase [Gemmatimonadota bacterium]
MRMRARPPAVVLALTLALGCSPEGERLPDAAVELLDITGDHCAGLPRSGYAELERVPVSDDWFEVYRVETGVYALYEPFQFQEVISYLVLGDEAALLFDTGMGIGSISGVVDELTALPVTVLNSHTHMDHVGGNAEFSRVLAMDTEFTRERARGRPNRLVRSEVAPSALCRPLPEDVTEDTYHTRSFVVTQYIRDGHVIDLGGRRLEVLAVPGHTPDAIALLDREAGFLWTGDSFYEGPIWLFAPETDLDAYETSMRRLAALSADLTTVFPAHNTPVAAPDGLPRLVEALERVRSGEMAGSVSGPGVEYSFDDFSLLLRAGTR